MFRLDFSAGANHASSMFGQSFDSTLLQPSPSVYIICLPRILPQAQHNTQGVVQTQIFPTVYAALLCSTQGHELFCIVDSRHLMEGCLQQCCLDVKAGGTAAETKVLLEEQHELHVSAQCGQVVSNGALNAEDGGSPTAIEGAPSSPASPLRKLGPSDFELLRVVGKGSFWKGWPDAFSTISLRKSMKLLRTFMTDVCMRMYIVYMFCAFKGRLYCAA